VVPVLRVHFGGEDLARTRVGPRLGALTETVLSLDALQPDGREALLAGWRRRVRRHAAQSLAQLTGPGARAWRFELVPAAAQRSAPTRRPARAAPGYLDSSPVAPGWLLQVGLDHGRRRPLLVDAFHAYHHAAVRPYWEAIRAVLESAQQRLVRTAGERGVEEMLSSLHPAIAWRPPVLEVRDREVSDREVRDREVPAADHRLNGRGLIVVPSFFGQPGHRVRVAADAAHGDEDPPYLLLVPVAPDVAGFAGVWPLAASHGPNLGALLGRTRAAVLHAVAAGGCTTSDLARRCGISLSSASQHATVLRDAGLIRSDRRRSAVLHSLTPVGESLLDGPASDTAETPTGPFSHT
jgi:DNA-binding transcriptional ArsR family regulator